MYRQLAAALSPPPSTGVTVADLSVVRDATVVRYREGEGVAPHVDGKDATLLVYLNTCRGGGHTVFPEDGLAFPPRQGGALLYDSRLDLLLYSQSVQVLILALCDGTEARDSEEDDEQVV